jgi:hypothetical protein
MRLLLSAVLVMAAAGTAGAGLAGPAAAEPGAASCSWSMRVLPTLPGAAVSFIRGTDGDRTFVGQSGDRPVLWRDGRLLALGGSGRPAAVNRRGEAVGTDVSDGHAALWRGTTQLGLAEPAGFTLSMATAINDAGLIVGSGSGPGSGGTVGLVWQAGRPDRVRVLDAPGGGDLFLTGVNRDGIIVGFEVANGNLVLSAVTGTPRSGLHPLAVPAGVTETSADAIAGQYIAGRAGGGSMVWHRGQPRLLPGTGTAIGVNSHGLVGGIDFATFGPVVWQDGIQVALPGVAPDALGSAPAVTESGAVGGSSGVPDQTGLVRYVPAVWTCR